MDATTTISTPMAERVIATLRAHEEELRAAGVAGLSLFGSVARGTDTDESDIDVVVELDRAGRVFGLLELVGLEQRVADMLGRKVDLLSEPIQKPRLRAKIDRDRRRVF